MRTQQLRRRFAQAGAITGVVGLAVLTTATAAFADTSQASANAITATFAGNQVANTGTSTASNDGTQSPQTAGSSGGAVNDAASSLTVSGLAQSATANPDGSSYACAGVVGPAGVVQLGQPLGCTNNNATHGVNIGNGQIVANAVYATCAATPKGVTGNATLVDLNVGGSGQPGAIAAPPNETPFPNNPLFNIVLNKQTPNADGSLTITALDVTALTPAQGGLHVAIGTVTCGPNATTGATPTIPVKGLPIAAGVAALAAGGLWIGRRRLVSRA